MSRMSKRFARLGACCLLVAVVLTAHGQSDPQERTWERYGILTERNIFDRSRQAPRPTPSPVETPPAPAIVDDTDRYLVLKGVGQQQVDVAFIEDVRTNRTVRVPTGGVIGKGTVVTIALTHIEYRRDGDTVTIEIGGNLAGLAVPDVPPPSPDGAPTPPADGATPAVDGSAPPPAAPSGAADLLEQMRQRRQQQTNR